jgi:hypothetical protein
MVFVLQVMHDNHHFKYYFNIQVYIYIRIFIIRKSCQYIYYIIFQSFYKKKKKQKEVLILHINLHLLLFVFNFYSFKGKILSIYTRKPQ